MNDENRTILKLYSLLKGTPIKFGPHHQRTTTTTTTKKPSTLKPGPDKLYLTTAINYTNGEPHFGHAYEAVMSDIIVRYHRACNRQVYFLTGTDEHGQKVQKSAESRGATPKEHCDYYAAKFKSLDARLLVEYDRFVRTTDPDHYSTAKKLWRLVKDDIYLSNYEGWYNRYDEQYVTPAEIETCPKNEQGIPLDSQGRELEKKNEQAYFFKMSKYADRLREHIKNNPYWIQPSSARGEIIAFLESPLEDLCVSRTSISWGVPVPTDVEGVDDPKHVMYVWFDALTNYLTGVNGLDSSDPKSKFWPASVHIIGKDIVRFHTVYWPTMLMAAGIPLPEHVFAHGFITAADGQKMGKSLGNSRDPHEQLDLYGVDALRYYMARAASFGWDLAYNDQHLCDANNDVLLKGFGNLVQRCYKVACDNCTENGIVTIPDVEPIGIPFDLHSLKCDFEACFSVSPSSSTESSGDDASQEGEKCGLRIRDAVIFLEKAVSDANKFVDSCEPWKRKGPENEIYRKQCARAFLDSIFCLAHFYRVFTPLVTSTVIQEVLQTNYVTNILELDSNFCNLKPGSRIRSFDAKNPLFLIEALEVGKGQKQRLTSGEDIVRARQEERDRRNAETAQNKKAKETAKLLIPLDNIELRVGEIKEAKLVEGTKLIIEKVLIGTDSFVDVISGIADHYQPPNLIGKRVVIALNLEPFSPKQVPDFISKGMLLGAKSKDGTKLELVQPPKSSSIGEKLIASQSVETLDNGSMKIAGKKQWEKARDTLKVDENGIIRVGDDKLFGIICKQECNAETIRDGTVS